MNRFSRFSNLHVHFSCWFRRVSHVELSFSPFGKVVNLECHTGGSVGGVFGLTCGQDDWWVYFCPREKWWFDLWTGRDDDDDDDDDEDGSHHLILMTMIIRWSSFLFKKRYFISSICGQQPSIQLLCNRRPTSEWSDGLQLVVLLWPLYNDLFLRISEKQPFEKNIRTHLWRGKKYCLGWVAYMYFPQKMLEYSTGIQLGTQDFLDG